MSGRVVGAIDCGTNSTRLLVTDGSRTLERLMRITRLGEGVAATGRLSPAAVERTVQHLTLSQQEATVATLLTPYGVSILPSSTEARETCAMETGFAGTRKPLFVMRYTGGELNRLPQALLSRRDTGLALARRSFLRRASHLVA